MKIMFIQRTNLDISHRTNVELGARIDHLTFLELLGFVCFFRTYCPNKMLTGPQIRPERPHKYLFFTNSP